MIQRIYGLNAGLGPNKSLACPAKPGKTVAFHCKGNAAILNVSPF